MFLFPQPAVVSSCFEKNGHFWICREENNPTPRLPLVSALSHDSDVCFPSELRSHGGSLRAPRGPGHHFGGSAPVVTSCLGFTRQSRQECVRACVPVTSSIPHLLSPFFPCPAVGISHLKHGGGCGEALIHTVALQLSVYCLYEAEASRSAAVMDLTTCWCNWVWGGSGVGPRQLGRILENSRYIGQSCCCQRVLMPVFQLLPDFSTKDRSFSVSSESPCCICIKLSEYFEFRVDSRGRLIYLSFCCLATSVLNRVANSSGYSSCTCRPPRPTHPTSAHSRHHPSGGHILLLPLSQSEKETMFPISSLFRNRGNVSKIFIVWVLRSRLFP